MAKTLDISKSTLNRITKHEEGCKSVFKEMEDISEETEISSVH